MQLTIIGRSSSTGVCTDVRNRDAFAKSFACGVAATACVLIANVLRGAIGKDMGKVFGPKVAAAICASLPIGMTYMAIFGRFGEQKVSVIVSDLVITLPAGAYDSEEKVIMKGRWTRGEELPLDLSRATYDQCVVVKVSTNADGSNEQYALLRGSGNNDDKVNVYFIRDSTYAKGQLENLENLVSAHTQDGSVFKVSAFTLEKMFDGGVVSGGGEIATHAIIFAVFGAVAMVSFEAVEGASFSGGSTAGGICSGAVIGAILAAGYFRFLIQPITRGLSYILDRIFGKGNVPEMTADVATRLIESPPGHDGVGGVNVRYDSINHRTRPDDVD